MIYHYNDKKKMYELFSKYVKYYKINEKNYDWMLFYQ